MFLALLLQKNNFPSPRTAVLIIYHITSTVTSHSVKGLSPPYPHLSSTCNPSIHTI